MKATAGFLTLTSCNVVAGDVFLVATLERGVLSALMTLGCKGSGSFDGRRLNGDGFGIATSTRTSHWVSVEPLEGIPLSQPHGIVGLVLLFAIRCFTNAPSFFDTIELIAEATLGPF